MADQYKTLWECKECFETSESRDEVLCHNQAGRLYVCEVCQRDFNYAELAKNCCAKSKVDKPVALEDSKPIAVRRPVLRPVPKIAPAYSPTKFPFVVIRRTPRRGCPRCGIAQKLGTVVYCACMI